MRQEQRQGKASKSRKEKTYHGGWLLNDINSSKTVLNILTILIHLSRALPLISHSLFTFHSSIPVMHCIWLILPLFSSPYTYPPSPFFLKISSLHATLSRSTSPSAPPPRSLPFSASHLTRAPFVWLSPSRIQSYLSVFPPAWTTRSSLTSSFLPSFLLFPLQIHSVAVVLNVYMYF